MASGRYEIDVDLVDEVDESSSLMDVEQADYAGTLKSAVTKKKGRGFSSADATTGFEGINHFDRLSDDNVGVAQKSVEGWAIFVTGLHEECTEEDLYDKFVDFGPIKDLKMPLDHRTGYVKGYALLEYASYEEAKAAIDNMNGQLVMEQEVRCDFAFVRGPSSHATGYRSGNVRQFVKRGEVVREEEVVVTEDPNGTGRRLTDYKDLV